MHKVTGQAGGIVWTIGTYSDLNDAMEAHEAAWINYQQACHIIKHRPPIKVCLLDDSGRVLHTRVSSRPKRAETGPDMIPVVAMGIPALARVTHYSPAVAGYYPVGNMRANEPAEPAEVEVEMYDRKGYRAKWLEDNMTEDQLAEVEQQVLGYLEESRDY